MALFLNCLAALIAVAIGVLQFTHVFDHPLGRALVISLSFIAAICIVTATLIAAKESREQKLIQRQLAESQKGLQDTLQQLAHDLAAKSAPSLSITSAPSQQPSLKQRVAQLAEELFAFLKDKGPEPANPMNHLRSLDADWKRIRDAHWAHVERIHYGYLAHFKDRVKQVDYELAEIGIKTGLELWEIDPPQAVREVNVRKIAETFLLVAARMD